MPRFLMLGWDAADWKIALPLIDRGELTNLRRLIERGTIADLTTMQPPLSPMLWNTMATGHRPQRHGILGFVEVDEQTGDVRPSSSLSRRCKALWNIATQAGRQVRVVNWLATHPAEPVNGVCVSDSLVQGIERETIPILPPASVHPAARLAEFSELRVSAH